MALKARSPNSPNIPLDRAVKHIRVLYTHMLHHPSAREAILGHLNYSVKSSSGIQTFSTLKQFGLLDAKHGGEAKLSKLALLIVQDDREVSPERDAAIKRAAKNPQIHKELWEKYDGKLPSDADIRFFLQNERHFTPKRAADLVKQFRKTIDYAKLTESDTESEVDGDKPNGGPPSPSVGDWVQWEKNGILRLEKPHRIAGFYGPDRAYLEGSPTGIRVEELIPARPPDDAFSVPLLSPPAPQRHSGSREMKQATLPLDEGVMMFQWSSPLSASSRELAKVWIDSIVKKLIDTTDDQQPPTAIDDDGSIPD